MTARDRDGKATVEQLPPLRRVGDIQGPVHYLGSCPRCRQQYMSPNVFVGPGNVCEPCVRAAVVS